MLVALTLSLILSSPFGRRDIPFLNWDSPILYWTKKNFAALEGSSIWYRVAYGRKAPVNPEIVFLAIDQASTSASLDSIYTDQDFAASRPLSLMRMRFPYPREVYALAYDRLIGAGARGVALDLLFPGPSDNDTAWAAAIDRYRDKIVLGTNFGEDLKMMVGTSSSENLTIPSATLLPDQDPFDTRLGYVNYWPDSDDIVRDAQYRANLDSVNGNPGAEKEPKLYSLAARLVQKSGHADAVPDDLKPRTMRYAGPPLKTFTHYSFYQLFDPHDWETTFQNGNYFKDKIVLIGPSGDFAKDKSSTPYGLMDGAEIHLNAINDLLQNEFLQRPSTGLVCVIVILAGVLAFVLAMTIDNIGLRFLATFGIIGCYVLALLLAYNGPGWLLPAVAPLSVFGGATGTGFIYDFVLTQIEKLRLRTTFERYNSKNVVKYLLENTESYKEMLAGTRRPVTVLFSDIRSFTTIVETTPDSHALVDKLNEYFTAMVDCVFRFDGSLDKFMGDGIMAVWGNTPYNFGPKEDAVRAVRSALAMLVELRRLNAKWLAEGKTEWNIGIGLNHGQVIVGDMGSQQHKEFGVVGDAINLGSRLEGLTKEYRLQLIVGERVAELVIDQFYLKSVDFVQVKGKTRPVQAFTILGDKSDPLPLEKQKALALYEEGISHFRQRDFSRARELFAQSLELTPGDYLTTQYVDSCSEYIANPPDAKWTGIRIMHEK